MKQVETFFAVPSFADGAGSCFDEKNSWAIFRFAAGMVWMFLQEDVSLEFFEFMDSLSIEMCVDGERFVKKSSATLLEAACCCEVVGLWGDVSYWAVKAERVGALGYWI